MGPQRDPINHTGKQISRPESAALNLRHDLFGKVFSLFLDPFSQLETFKGLHPGAGRLQQFADRLDLSQTVGPTG